MSDLAGKVSKARGILPLQTLMAQRRKEPSNGKWARFPHCPYCTKPGAGLREKNGRQWFKCFHVSCPSGTAGEKGAWDEVGFLAYELGLSRKEAFKVWLKEAGVLWEEPPKRGTARREYLPEEEADAYYDDLPPEARGGSGEPIDPGPEPEPPSDVGLLVEPPSLTAAPSKVVFTTSDGSAAVPDLIPPVAGQVNVSPAAPAGVPTPMPGEASLSPPVSTTAGPPVVTSAEPLAPDAAPPAVISVNFQPGVQTSAPSATPEEEKDEEKDEEEVPMTVLAMRRFYQHLVLTKADADRLWAKRGLTPESVAALGLRSSLRSNEGLLRGMADLFPMNALLEAGLWERGGRPGDEPKPNPFYFGRGPAGKRKTPLGPEMLFDWVHPILIPYLNREGEVMDLRTHKWTQKGQAPRLYVPRRLGFKAATPEVDFAVITEGEFKAGAIWQALPRAMIGGMPGISMSKVLWASVLDWLLEDLPPNRPVVVVFDNEDKGREGLPGYKGQWWLRHDTELWARYLERRLAAEGIPARVGILPDECRDANGKADWDGWLALLVKELGRQQHLL